MSKDLFGNEIIKETVKVNIYADEIQSKIWKNRLDVNILNSSKMLFVDENVSLIADSFVCKLNLCIFYLGELLILLYVCPIEHIFY